MLPALSVAVTTVVVVILALQVALVGYLLLLTVSALVTPARGAPTTTRIRRFAVLVPAHNEEGVIARVLTSLKALNYPADSVDICVVADNCDDGTALIARRLGAQVFERSSLDERAKGFALKWLIQSLSDAGRKYDAFVVVDADSVLAPNFLSCMNARLEAGALAIQAYYAVLNPGQSTVAGLRYAALAAVHYLRPLGRLRCGLSAGLKGNGMCFSAEIMERFAWRWFTLAEDVEFHLALVAEGIRVEFAPETWVKADMPVTLQQAASQNARWERGRLQLMRQHVPRLLWDGLRNRSCLQIDAAAEQLIPPLSVPFALGAATAVAAALLGNFILAVIAAGCLGGYILYLMTALALVRAPLRAYLTLGAAPVYIAWKVGVYARSLVGERSSAWVRTERTPGTATPS